MTVMENEDPADPTVHEPRVTDAPQAVWLVYGDLDHDATHRECCESGEVTWCEDAQFLSDVRYIRADLLYQQAREIAAEQVAAERKRRGAALAADVAGMPDVMSFPPLPPSPAEVGDLILQTREHVQALGWGNREQLYTASQVRAVMSECAAMAAAREREHGLRELRDAVRQLAALNAWYHFGDCRAWTAGPILSPIEADELARRVLRA